MNTDQDKRLGALVERLEAAVGPDRELDGRIYWATNRKSAERAYWQTTTGTPRALSDEYPPRGLGTYNIETVTPRYTSSIDSALTLVPEGQIWRVSFNGNCANATIREPTDQWTRDYIDNADAIPRDVTAHTPALALTAAALRSRLSSQSQEK